MWTVLVVLFSERLCPDGIAGNCIGRSMAIHRASGVPITNTLDCLIKLFHPFDEASAWPRDRSSESPSWSPCDGSQPCMSYGLSLNTIAFPIVQPVVSYVVKRDESSLFWCHVWGSRPIDQPSLKPIRTPTPVWGIFSAMRSLHSVCSRSSN